MGRQKRTSGRRYESSSEHSFIICGIYKGVIGMVLYSKACQKCDATDKRGEEGEEHDCPNNFEGSYKIMEAAAILKMVEYEFCDCCFIIDVIVRDNDRTM